VSWATTQSEEIVPALPHVAILHWPADSAVVAYLRAERQPRLLLVAPDAPAPTTVGWDEDWIRLPAREDDVRTRADALRARAAARPPRPELAFDGRLSFGGQWIALSPTESALARLLVDRFGEVVGADELGGADNTRRLSATAVRVHLTRLRKRIKPLGLGVRPVRGQGYVLDIAAPATHTARASRAGAGTGRVDVGALTLDLDGGRAIVGDVELDFTPTELHVLAVLARHPDRIVRQEEILQQVWGSDADDAQQLRVYVSQIRRKLSDHPGSPELITEPGVGYRLS
jgi:DNA-binding response OmpR family regulator